jgi:hypothetical protein
MSAPAKGKRHRAKKKPLSLSEAEVRAIAEETKAEVYALAEEIKAYRRELTGVAALSFNEKENAFLCKRMDYAKSDDFDSVWCRAIFDLVLDRVRRGEPMSEGGLALLAGEFEGLASFMANMARIEPEAVKTKAEVLRAARQYRRLYKQYRQRRADEERLAGLVWERREINYLATTKYRGKRNAVACARKEVAEDRGIDAESIKPSHARIRRRFRGG